MTESNELADEPAPTAEDEPDTAATEPKRTTGLRDQIRRQRTALLIIGAIALLIIGFGAGVLSAPDTGREAQPGPVDIGFAQDMSAHHTQAVEMAGMALTGTSDPAIRRLAYDILTTQQGQIGRMQGWLQVWDAPARGTDGYMSWMPMTGQHGHDGGLRKMPGMATPDELQQLRESHGDALDVLFLQLMLRHHQGGVSMLEYGAEHADTTEITVIAGQMLPTQLGESQLMTGMLADRGAEPLPMN